MPLTADDFIQQNTGQQTVVGASIDVTLPAGTTAGNAVLVVIAGGNAAIVPPIGWVTAIPELGVMYAFHATNVAAGEGVAGSTPWTFTFTSGTHPFTWWAAEVENLSVEPLDVTVESPLTAVGNGGTKSTGTTALSAGMSTVQLALFYSAATASQWGSYTNGFTEVVDVAKSGAGEWGLAIARNFTDMATGTYECTATLSTSGGSANAYAMMWVLRSADSSIAAPLAITAGFDWGTHGGISSHTGASAMMGNLGAHSGTWGTNFLIQAGSARSSAYGLRVVQSAGAAWVRMGNLGGIKGASVGLNIRVVSGTGNAGLVYFVNSGGTSLGNIRYDATTNKFGISAGTTVWQAGTTALNTWVWVEFGLNVSSRNYHGEWRIETGTDTYSVEAPSDWTAGSIGAISQLQIGANAASTVTFDVDDVVVSHQYAAHPVGRHTVRLLVPETTGATVSGTSANFKRFTANGTLANVDGTEGGLLDDVPATISASADGVAQVTTAAADYLNLPMTTYTATSSEVIASVRMLAPLWGGTGTGTGTLGIRGHDGTTETTLDDGSVSYDADSLTAVSSTYPRWSTAMWVQSSGGWTQAKLDAAALRVGFSTDATPDMGIHAAYLEVATRPTPIYRQITAGEADEFAVDLRVHPYNSASVSYLLTSTHATRGATFKYSVSGTPQTPVYVNPSDTEEVVVNAASFGTITIEGFEPDPLP